MNNVAKYAMEKGTIYDVLFILVQVQFGNGKKYILAVMSALTK